MKKILARPQIGKTNVKTTGGKQIMFKKNFKRAVSWSLITAFSFGIGVTNPVYARASEEQDNKSEPVHVAELTQENNEYTRVFLNEDGSRTAYQYLDPIAFKDENGGYTLYDNTIVDSATEPGYYTNRAGDVNVLLPDDIAQNPVVVKDKNYSVEMKPITSIASTEQADKAASISSAQQSGEAASRTSIAQSNKASIPQANRINARKIKRGANYMSDEPQINGRRINHSDETKALDYSVQNNVTFEYAPTDRGVKENIVLSARPDTNEFYFELSSNGLTPQMGEGNVINMLNGQGEAVFAMPAPFMTDAQDNYSGNISVQLNCRGDGRYIVTIIPDEAFLADAVYPVTIDPTVSKPVTGTAQSYGERVVNDLTPNTQLFTRTLRVGYNGTRNYRIYIRPAIYWYFLGNYGPLGSDTSKVDDVQLVFYTYGTSVTSPATSVQLYDITPDPTRIGAYTWNNPGPANGTWGGVLADTQALPVTATPSAVSWDITDRFKYWMQNGYGQLDSLKQVTPNTRQVALYMKAEEESSSNNVRTLNGTRATGDDPSIHNVLRPFIKVTYHGSPDNHIVNSKITKLGSDADPVSMISGNFTWNYTDFAVYGSEPLEFTRFYNSLDQNESEIGYGWRHNYMYSVITEAGSTLAAVEFPNGNRFACDLSAGGTFVGNEGVTYTLAAASDGFLMTDQSQTKYAFDTNGQLISIVDVGGKTTTITRNGAEIATISNSSGTLTFTYNTDGKISEITDQTNRNVSYTYTDGNLTSFLNADNDTIGYTYDVNRFLTEISDFNGNTYLKNVYLTNTADGNFDDGTNTGYDDGDVAGSDEDVSDTDNNENIIDYSGRVAAQYMEGQGWSYFAYDFDNLVTTITAPDGAVRKYYYDANSNVIAVENIGGQTKYTYDADGRILSETDRLDNTTSYTYDENGNKTSTTYPDGTSELYEYNAQNLVNKMTNRDGTVELYDYDANGNQTSYTDARGNTSTSTYDENNNLLSNTDALGNTTTYTYDAKGNVLTETDPMNNTTSNTYDDQGRLITQTDADGSTTTYVYSDAGKLVKTIDADGNETNIDVSGNGFDTGNTDPLGNSTNTVYNEQNKPIAVTDAEGNTTTYKYDSVGQMISTADALGNATSYTYDLAGRMISMTDARGSTWTYEYDAEGRMTATADPLGNKTSTEYDRMGQTASGTNARGAVTSYDYDAMGRITKTTDALGYYTRSVYDPNGNEIERYDANGNKWSSVYDANDQLIKETDPLGNKTTYYYDANGRQIKTVSALGIYAPPPVFDRTGRIVKSFDAEGNATSYEYDALGRLIKTTSADGAFTTSEYNANGWLVSSTAQDGGVTAYTYNKNGQVLTITDALGGVTSYVYDALGRTISVTDALGGVTKSEFDANGNLSSTTNALGGVTSYTYDALNRVVSTADPMGNVTKTEYDANGNVIKVTNTDRDGNIYGVTAYEYDLLDRLVKTTDPEGYTVKYTYDPNGNTLTTTDGRGNITSTQYDGLDRGVKQVDQLGGFTVTKYDADGRVTQSINAEGAVTNYEYDKNGSVIKVADALDNSTTTTYDSMGRVATTTDAKGAVTAYTYTATGKVKTITDALGGVKSYEYDLLGNLIKETNELGKSITYTYDALSRPLTVTNPLGNADRFTYDALGRIKTVTDKNGNVTKYNYDANGNVIETIDALGHSSTFAYDAMNRLVKVTLYRIDDLHKANDAEVTLYSYDKRGLTTKEINAAGDSTIYVYDGNGNLIQKTDTDGYVTEYSQDPRNLVEAINYSDGKQVQFAYNKNGALVAMMDWNGTVNFALDVLDRITSVNDQNEKITRYTYDAVGNKTSMTYPDGTAANYTYDLLGRLTNLKDAENQNTVYQYNAASQLIATAKPNGWKEDYTFDAAGQLLTQLTHDPSDMTNKDILHSYTYDPQGNITHEARTGAGGQDKFDLTHTYDALNRLTGTTGLWGYKEHTYQYDSLGNLLYEKNANGTNKGNEYLYNSLNQQVKKVTDDKDTTNYTFDRRGNLVAGVIDKKNTVVEQYVYDATNRMVKGVNDKGEQSHYIYNGLGDLVANEWIIEKNAYGYTGVGNIGNGSAPVSAPSAATTQSGGSVTITVKDGASELASSVVAFAKNATQIYDVGGYTVQVVYNGSGVKSATVTGDGPGVSAAGDTAAVTGVTSSEQVNGVVVCDRHKNTTGLGHINPTGKGHTTGGTTGGVIPSVDNKKFSIIHKDFVLDYTSPLKNVIMETESGDGGLTYRYTYGLQKENVVISGAGNLDKLYYHHDRLGSTDLLTDNVAGKVMSYVTYDDWGAPTAKAVLKMGVRELDLVTEYTGHPWDQVLGVYYAKARMYDSQDRRFTAKDEAKDGLNRYLYCSNNPINSIDPMGLVGQSIQEFYYNKGYYCVKDLGEAAMFKSYKTAEFAYYPDRKSYEKLYNKLHPPKPAPKPTTPASSSSSSSYTPSTNSNPNIRNATNYAREHYNDANKKNGTDKQECAGFCANCLKAGGFKIPSTDYPNPYTLAYAQYVYLVDMLRMKSVAPVYLGVGKVVENDSQIEEGDLVFWDKLNKVKSDGTCSFKGQGGHIGYISVAAGKNSKFCAHNGAQIDKSLKDYNSLTSKKRWLIKTSIVLKSPGSYQIKSMSGTFNRFNGCA